MKATKIYNRDTPRDGRWTSAQASTPEAPSQESWTPAQVGRVLKIVLYVGVASAVWALNYFSGKTTAKDKDVLEGRHTSGPATAIDFSPWEPEP